MKKIEVVELVVKTMIRETEEYYPTNSTDAVNFYTKKRAKLDTLESVLKVIEDVNGKVVD